MLEITPEVISIGVGPAVPSIYRFDANGAEMRTLFWPRAREYDISSIRVHDYDRRGRGIGEWMLSQALEHAREVQAHRIVSYVVSRECLDAMRAVFGEDCLEVIEQGDYAPPGHDQNDGSPTQAKLDKSLI